MAAKVIESAQIKDLLLLFLTAMNKILNAFLLLTSVNPAHSCLLSLKWSWIVLLFCSLASLTASLCLCSLLKERSNSLLYIRCPFFSYLQTLISYSENSWLSFSVLSKSALFISALSVLCLNLFSLRYSEDQTSSLYQTLFLVCIQNLWRRDYILFLLTHLYS